MKFKQVHILAFKIALTSVALFLALFFSFYFLYSWQTDLLEFFKFTIVFFILLYLISLWFIQNYISKGIKNIYQNSALLQGSDIEENELTSDVDVFFKRVNYIIDDKHQEIEKLNTRDDFRREFLGNVSHELKTPLFTAQGYILTLLDDAFDDKTLQQKYLQRANKSIERLDFIVKDLDMIAKLESGMQLNFETVNIIKLIDGVFEMLEIKAGKKNITMTFDEPYEFPLLVRADVERMEQVLINLIANSINYGKENGVTTVSVKSHSKSQFLIRITDNGIGIEEEKIPRLFERFYRVDNSRSREQGGSGLGLAIVKHIIEAHNQNIFVESEIGKGSTFSFTINKIK